MFCPVCKSEYREGFPRCADCGVPLVSVLDGEPQSFEHAALARVWEGSDAHENSQVRYALERERIPYRIQEAGPNLLSLRNQAAEALYVPQAMLEQARTAIIQAIGNDADEMEIDESAEAPGESPSGEEDDSMVPAAEHGAWSAAWFPEDATVKIWEDAAGTGSDAVIVALEENHIHWRANDVPAADEDADAPITEIYVIPQDEARAREIIREVTEASPPA